MLRARLRQVVDIDETAAATIAAPSSAYDGDDYSRRDEQDSRSDEKEIKPVEAEEEARVLPVDPEFGPGDIPDISGASSESSSDKFDRALEERELPRASLSTHDESLHPSSYSVIEDDDLEDQEREVALEDALIDRTVRDIRRIRRAHHVRPRPFVLHRLLQP